MRGNDGGEGGGGGVEVDEEAEGDWCGADGAELDEGAERRENIAIVMPKQTGVTRAVQESTRELDIEDVRMMATG